MCFLVANIIVHHHRLYCPPESRAVTITSLSKDRVQEQVSDTNSGADEYVTKMESQYFTQVAIVNSVPQNYSYKCSILWARDLSSPWLLVGG